MKTPAFPVEEPPKKLKINLDLAIYRGRTLVFKRQFSQAERIFRKVSFLNVFTTLCSLPDGHMGAFPKAKYLLVKCPHQPQHLLQYIEIA
jgi:hypothetical protein